MNRNHPVVTRATISAEKNISNMNDNQKTDGRNNNFRRDFLKKVSAAAVAGALGAQTWFVAKSLLTPVTQQSSHRWKIGHPEQFEQGVTFVEQAKTFIVRQDDSMIALSAVCTHLGCTLKKVNKSGENDDAADGVEFHCPCHNSKFHVSGENYAGPAEKPLQHFRLIISPDDGQLIVDHSQPVDADNVLQLT
ncbi:MAG: Rieske 2Fe-2S domain-containing protein [Candidatus Marinimicrobia bacterium]|nr:Rieske 2Fe-2S domain-containing protein [Candidatus Neomarinimicrobiota bacterium]